MRKPVVDQNINGRPSTLPSRSWQEQSLHSGPVLTLHFQSTNVPYLRPGSDSPLSSGCLLADNLSGQALHCTKGPQIRVSLPRSPPGCCFTDVWPPQSSHAESPFSPQWGHDAARTSPSRRPNADMDLIHCTNPCHPLIISDHFVTGRQLGCTTSWNPI